MACAAAVAAGASGAASYAESSISDYAAARIAVVSIPACPYCKRAKEALSTAGYAFVVVDVSHDESLRQHVRELSGSRTVPQVFVAGRSIGGSDDLQRQMDDGSFAALVQGSAAPALPQELLALVQEGQERRAQEEAAAGITGASSQAARLAQLAAELADPKTGVQRRELQIGSKTYKVFSGADLLAWRRDPGPHLLAQELLEGHVVARPPMPEQGGGAPAAAAGAGGFSLNAQYILVSEAPAPQRGEPLNGAFLWSGPARPADTVANDLRARILDLYDSYLSADGRAVNYKGMRADPRFAAFVAATTELQQVDLAPLSREQLLAFGINLYNALVVHALVAFGSAASALQRSKFFSDYARYTIGGQPYTADDLEHGLLRGNRAGAANLFNLLGLHQLSGGHWKGGDARLRTVVQPLDPRIHFALVCGAKSCPPIKVYTAANLDEALTGAAEAFCQSEVEVVPSKSEVRMSKIFKWYAMDFGSNQQERLKYVLQYLAEPVKDDLVQMLASRRDIKVVYKEYDWSLNGSDDQ